MTLEQRIRAAVKANENRGLDRLLKAVKSATVKRDPRPLPARTSHTRTTR